MKKLNQKLVNFEIFINQVGAIYKLLCHIISCGFLYSNKKFNQTTCIHIVKSHCRYNRKH